MASNEISHWQELLLGINAKLWQVALEEKLDESTLDLILEGARSLCSLGGKKLLEETFQKMGCPHLYLDMLICQPYSLFSQSSLEEGL